ncbi:MAG: outer membrane protein [Micropepsaceae bacterium]
MKTKIALAASAAVLGYTWFAAANATHFEGVYIGLHGGFGIADADYVHFQPLLPQTEPLSFSDAAAVGGGQLGVRFDIGPDWILGLEATYTAGTIDDTVGADPAIVLDRSRSIEISDQFTAVLQLGHSWGDWLVYIKGGYANAQIDTYSNIISSGQLTSTSSDRESGWTAGVGIDHAIAPNVTLGLSYDYSSYSPDDRLNVQVAPFLAATTHIQNIDANVHLVTARLSWTF